MLHFNFASDMERRVGSALSLTTTIVNATLSLIYVPLLLAFLSGSEYGIYELIGSLIGYMSILDMGFSTTLTRFCVKERANGKKAEDNLLAVAGIVYAAITILAVVVGIIVDMLLDAVMSSGLDQSELQLCHQMMVLVIINSAIVLPGNYFLSIINSHENFIFSRLLLLCRYILQFVGVIVFLFMRSGAVGAVLAQVVANLITVLISVRYCRNVLAVRPHLYHMDIRLIRELFSYSGLILLGLIFNQVFLKTGQVILGAIAGSFVVGVYSLSCKVVSLYIQVANAISTVYLPKLTRLCLDAKNRSAEINSIFFNVGKIQSVLVWGVLSAFVVVGKDFIFLWAGGGYSDVYYLAIILMAGFSIDLVQNLGIQLLQARNHLAFRSVILSIICVLIVGLSVIFAPAYGAVACAVSTGGLMLIASGPFMNWYYAKREGIRIGAFWKSLLPEALSQIAIVVIASLLCRNIIVDGTLGFLIKTCIFIFVFAVIHLILYRKYIGNAVMKLKRN